MSREKWLATMVSRYGSETAVKQEMARRARNLGKLRVAKGLSMATPERRMEISRMGVEARKANK